MLDSVGAKQADARPTGASCSHLCWRIHCHRSELCIDSHHVADVVDCHVTRLHFMLTTPQVCQRERAASPSRGTKTCNVAGCTVRLTRTRKSKIQPTRVSYAESASTASAMIPEKSEKPGAIDPETLTDPSAHNCCMRSLKLSQMSLITKVTSSKPHRLASPRTHCGKHAIIHTQHFVTSPSPRLRDDQRHHKPRRRAQTIAKCYSPPQGRRPAPLPHTHPLLALCSEPHL